MITGGEIRIHDVRMWQDEHGTTHTDARFHAQGMTIAGLDTPFTSEHPWLCIHEPGEDCPSGTVTAAEFEEKFAEHPVAQGRQ